MGWTELIQGQIPDFDRRVLVYDMGQQQLEEDLLQLFEETLTEKSGDLMRAHQSGDDKGLAAAAHSIKGMGGMAGRPEISVLADEIEKRLHAGDRDGLDGLVDVLRQCLQLVPDVPA